MKWVSFKIRKPQQDGYYFWKGKSNYGGKAMYYGGMQSFLFDKSIPENIISEDYLFWLDEGDECNAIEPKNVYTSRLIRISDYESIAIEMIKRCIRQGNYTDVFIWGEKIPRQIWDVDMVLWNEINK